MHTLARSVLIGAAVMATIAASFAVGRGPVPAHQLRDKPFQDTLSEDIATMAAASERIEQLNKPRVVQTESVKPIEADPLMAVLSDPAPPRRRAVAATDICTRHGMVKVWVSKYRWRCRR